MSHIDVIRTEFLFEFSSMQEWINKASIFFEPYSSETVKTVCLDKGGNVLTSGKDFADAQTLGTYPIKVYRLIRVSEVADALIADVFNQPTKI